MVGFQWEKEKGIVFWTEGTTEAKAQRKMGAMC
jgi:hypothetical protein